MTVKGGTNHACAACKYQRRKCGPDCALAPYFPHDQPKMFQNAHRLFGVSNIQKILKPLTPQLREEATKSIIYEANMRARFPVDGCQGIIMQLQYQYQQTKLELDFVKAQLDMYRQQQTPELLQLGNLNTTAAAAAAASQSPDYNMLSLFQQQSYDDNNNASMQSFSNENNQGYGNSDVTTADYIKNEIVNPLWIQHDFNTSNNDDNTAKVQSHEFFIQQQPVSFQQEPDVLESQDYDEMPAFFDAIDDKEGYESSPESSTRDAVQSIEHVSENELKNAAACFSLTSVN